VKNDPIGAAIAIASLALPAMVLAVIAAGHGTTEAPSTSPSVTIPVPAPIRTASAADRVDVAAYSRAEIRCLARAMWNEAGNQSREGKIAVAEVVVARSKDRRWKGNLCQTIRMADQFSFVKNGRTVPLADPDTAQRMMDLARAVVSGRVSSRAKGALYYHADYAHPVWRHSLRRTTRIQTHVFYADALPKRPKTRSSV
jgi:spore germination cell wall hydrolase CwlJ-like protein